MNPMNYFVGFDKKVINSGLFNLWKPKFYLFFCLILVVNITVF